MSPREVCKIACGPVIAWRRMRCFPRTKFVLRTAFTELMALAGVRARAQPPWSAHNLRGRAARHRPF